MNSVLVYHSISTPAEQLPGDIDISAHRFERQLRWLENWRRVVRLSETLGASENECLTAITFDDGFRDNLTVALPLLEKYQFPITLFVTPGFLGCEGYLTPEELRELSQHPLVTIGAHGLWHRHFTRLEISQARVELLESRRFLAALTGRRVDLMAWPYGECDARLEDLSQECGYRASWTVWKGTNSTHSRWRVPLGRRDSIVNFIVKASGGYALTKAKWHRFEEKRERKSLGPVPAGSLLA